MWVWLRGVLLPMLVVVDGVGFGAGNGVSSSRGVVFGGVGGAGGVVVVVVEGWSCCLLVLRWDRSCLVSALSLKGKVDF